jgi:hypothetical protein
MRDIYVDLKRKKPQGERPNIGRIGITSHLGVDTLLRRFIYDTLALFPETGGHIMRNEGIASGNNREQSSSRVISGSETAT